MRGLRDRVEQLEGAGLRAGTIMALGDSITINGWYTDRPCQTFNAQSYLAWVSLLSGGRLRLYCPPGRFLPVAATSGLTTAQIAATHLPTVAAAKPGYCVVLAGSNDQPGASAANTASCIAGLRRLYEGLLAAGITPIVCTVPPRADAAYTFGFSTVNAWVKRYAADRGLPCADVFSALVDPATTGSYLAGLHAGDQIHPNAAGGKVIGQTIWQAIDAQVPAAGVPFPATNTRAAADTADALGPMANALFLSDGGAGIPSNYVVQAGAGTQAYVADGTAKLLALTSGGAGGYGVWNALNSDPISVGDRLLFIAKVQSTVEASAGKAQFMLLDSNSGKQAGIDDWTVDIPAGSVLAMEFSWPQSAAGLRARPLLVARTAAGAVATWGRLALLNLSRQGIA